MTRAALLLVGVVACSRQADAPAAPDAAPPAPVVVTASREAGAPARPTAIVPGEARRARLARFEDDASLPAATLGKHFGGAPASVGFDVQVAELSLDHRRAVLAIEAGKPTSEARPIVVVTDARGDVWTRERPVAGIQPPVGPVALAAGAKGRVALAVCDPPTKTVALRLWDDDGSPFADVAALQMDACDAVTLLHWPHHGYVLVAVATGQTRARFVDETGSLGWEADLGARSRAEAIAPASLAVDTDDTFVLLQAVQPTGERRSPFHALAFRYDLRGQPIWQAAVDLGELPRPLAPGERIALDFAPPAGAHAKLAGVIDAEVKPSGAVTKGPAPR